ncbi:guanine nucleotide-binding protein subunit beta-2-like [Limulus polyphemus]|uniref:Guanine nucleotide-binding protein subunit beta-2-like n=1 Tax=Limulus polyphemus TaxID=6850 RepID=A0ABM1SIW2_LIMPO|nr:guanine nucleotide-binding protein subunit beta-2-like [Limulus polyphemus]
MASDDCGLEIDNPGDSIESLSKEVEKLKARLEEERQKLNDVALYTVAERLDPLPPLNIKPRRVLKGHQGKVLCSDWSLDKRHIVSSSQVNCAVKQVMEY